MPIEQNIPIFDGHNDTLLDLNQSEPRNRRTFFEPSTHGHIDLPRAQAGGLGGGFFAIFTQNRAAAHDPDVGVKGSETAFEIPAAPPVDQTYALQATMDMAALLFRLERQANGRVKVVRTADELEHSLQSGIFAMIFHIEGAEAIDTNLNALEVLYHAGLRSIGITWSRPNAFGTGVPFKFPQSPDIGPGLTSAGKELVRTCNQLGILVDLAHLNERGFWDVAGISDAPMISTHSCAYAISASARNLTDAQLDAVRDTSGVVGVNFHVGFLRPDGRANPDTSLEQIVRHVDYMVERMGIDHVALGSDFDGATMPNELGDAAGLPKLMDTLRANGYEEDALRKIAHQNWLRVLRQTWKAAS